MNGVVPFAVEAVPLDAELAHLLCRDLGPRRVTATVDLSGDLESSLVGGVADQGHYGFVRTERAPSPVDRDEREQAVLDLVPLARAGREVVHVNGHAEHVGEALQLELPRTGPIAVAAAGVGGDEQF